MKNSLKELTTNRGFFDLMKQRLHFVYLVGPIGNKKRITFYSLDELLVHLKVICEVDNLTPKFSAELDLKEVGEVYIVYTIDYFFVTGKCYIRLIPNG